MTECLWCQAPLALDFSLTRLLSLQPLRPFPRCQECSQKLVLIDQAAASCPHCCRIQDGRDPCEDCQRWAKLYPGRNFNHQAVFSYEGLIKDWLIQFKYRGDYRLRSFIQPEISSTLSTYSKEAVLVPIPLSQESQDQRGFNQVIAVLEACGLPYQDLLLHTNPASSRQAKKNRKDRMESTQVFGLNQSRKLPELTKPLVIVDDVYTTGRTLHHAYDLLAEAGYFQISSFTFARTRADDKS